MIYTKEQLIEKDWRYEKFIDEDAVAFVLKFKKNPVGRDDGVLFQITIEEYDGEFEVSIYCLRRVPSAMNEYKTFATYDEAKKFVGELTQRVQKFENDIYSAK